MGRLPDIRIRARKAAGDLWSASGHAALAALMVGVGALCTHLQALDVGVTAGVTLLTLLGVGMALAPLGRARSAEILFLRLLGATDSDVRSFAVLESGALGALTGLAGVLLTLALGRLSSLAGLHMLGAGSLETLALWPLAAGLTGALAGALAFRSAR